MYSLKGFVSIGAFANNAIGITAPIGELSSYSNTYSREKGLYSSSSYPNIEIVSFSSRLDGVMEPVPTDIQATMFAVANWIFATVVNKTHGDDQAAFLNDLISNNPDKVSNLDAGVMVGDGTYYAPEWVSWTIPNTDNYIKLWFVDASFQTQYDEFEIIVVPALETLDDFFKSGTEVEAKINAMSMSLMVDRIQQAKNDVPETVVRVEAFDYIDPANSTHTVSTKWGELIYGEAGNNTDSSKDALATYILAHSTKTRAQWSAILPEIFKRTEFILTPLWDQYAIPNRVLEAGIYSPIAQVGKALTNLKKAAVGYSAAHVENNWSLFGHPYKSLAVAVIGGIENRDGKYKLGDFYGDYIAVGSTSNDFNRMSAATQNWAYAMDQLIQNAEILDAHTALPFGTTRVKRDNILYVAKTIDNIHFLIPAKSNFPTN